MQRHRVHLGQASPPAPGSCWPHKPLRWQQWSLPGVCGAAALLLPWLVLCRGCSAPAPPATAWGWHSWHSSVITALSGNVEGAPGQLWVCFTVGNSLMVGKRRVLNDCGRRREKIREVSMQIWTYTNVSKNCKDRDKDKSACAAFIQTSANMQPTSTHRLSLKQRLCKHPACSNVLLEQIFSCSKSHLCKVCPTVL